MYDELHSIQMANLMQLSQIYIQSRLLAWNLRVCKWQHARDVTLLHVFSKKLLSAVVIYFLFATTQVETKYNPDNNMPMFLTILTQNTSESSCNMWTYHSIQSQKYIKVNIADYKTQHEFLLFRTCR